MTKVFAGILITVVCIALLFAITSLVKSLVELVRKKKAEKANLTTDKDKNN